MSTSSCRPARAIVFDLWKTLVPLPDVVKQAAFNGTARALHETPSRLADSWQRSRVRRETGQLREYLLWLRAERGSTWTESMIDEAMQTRRQIHGAMFQTPTQGAVKVLSDLRTAGIPTAIVSNASSDVRDMFDKSPLAEAVDHIVLSAEVGIMKPDPQIFHVAATALGVAPDACLYLGDGNDHELDGAAAAGMTPILFDLGDGQTWSGRRVTRLRELIAEVPLP